ncbi:MAG: sigma 54-interacting transcriptional regulator [Desulfarculaceae bacterium]|nr:sigma 54-interacting transcriptional regulator [Desulfarculaceae bacterium]MCF8071484.1 sigma 54-interacting transcriptional regulator [Desulfarculaceae bacterium]MCF8102299.1 sigma 54-interacting transcriptional regulator [Desulfarculaceae bacterium]MCF8114763.1 sigma 54-interacting transcriptional regulator [Desulfarculaceae bacterium]
MSNPTPSAPSQGLTELILDSITEGVFTVDPGMRIQSFNQAAQNITGISQAEAVGKKCREILRAGICGGNCPLSKSMATGDPGLEVDVEITGSDGNLIPVRIRTAVLRDAQGRVVGGVETFRDLSDMHHLLKRITEGYTFCDLKGKSEPMRQLFRVLPEAARSGATVLIRGESGTGKELVARALHDLSPRHEGPFVAVNCAAIPEALMESELFGHVRGAFTGADRERQGRLAAAQGGTLFLDEIGDLPLALQVKLLRALDSGEYSPLGSNQARQAEVRVVAATHRDLEAEMSRGAFRQDLYYRLNVVELKLPPLRDRREDIPLLVGHFLERLAAERGEPVRRVNQAALARLMEYPWPGNVRELQNALEHALVLARGRALEVRHLPANLQNAPVGAADQSAAQLNLEQRERAAMEQALALNQGHRGRTAASLGISPTTLWRKMKKYGLIG